MFWENKFSAKHLCSLDPDNDNSVCSVMGHLNNIADDRVMDIPFLGLVPPLDRVPINYS